MSVMYCVYCLREMLTHVHMRPVLARPHEMRKTIITSPFDAPCTIAQGRAKSSQTDIDGHYNFWATVGVAEMGNRLATIDMAEV